MKSITSYKVFPRATDVGCWSLWIETPYGDGPLGPRFYFGGTAPDGGFDFDQEEKAKIKSQEWMEYFRQMAKKAK